MSLVTLDLPAPAEMRGRWAAVSAVLTAMRIVDACHADDRSVWHYDDSGGNWVELHHVDGGRAVLVGNDHEYSQTYYGTAAEYFGEEETDLLAGAPHWWEPPVRKTMAPGLYVGFVYGYDGATWRRAAYELEDGFRTVDLPALSIEKTRSLIVEFCGHIDGLDGDGPSETDIDALAAADADVTEELVRAVIGPTGLDATAAVAAARRFRRI